MKVPVKILIRTRYDCSFVSLPSKEERKNYAVYRFYHDPLGKMTLMWTENDFYSGGDVSRMLYCRKEGNDWIARKPIKGYVVETFDDSTPEFAALELLVSDEKRRLASLN